MLLLLWVHRGWRNVSSRLAPRRPTCDVADGRHVTLACPVCGTPQPATEKIHERRSAHRAHCDERFFVFQCDHCHTEFNAASCLDNGQGAFTVTPWRCPLCQTENGPQSRQCANCHVGGTNVE